MVEYTCVFREQHDYKVHVIMHSHRVKVSCGIMLQAAQLFLFVVVSYPLYISYIVKHSRSVRVLVL